MNATVDFNGQCRFPAVVLYHGGDMSVYDALDPFIICRKVDLKAGQRGRFARATVIDSEGKSWEMNGAAVLHGVGRFWGYNILLSRTIRVRPNVSSPPTTAKLDWVRTELVKRLSKKGEIITLDLKGFCATIDWAEAVVTARKVEVATSISQVIGILLDMDFPERSPHRSSIH